MTVEEFLPHLEAVRRTSRGYMARCPAHPDRHPSLSVSSGERGILVKCWAGCRAQDIAAAVGVNLRDLFYNQIQDIHERREAQWRREAEIKRREELVYTRGLTIDMRREAERLLASARNPGNKGWTDEDLQDALNVVADAHDVLLSEKVEHGDYPVRSTTCCL